MPGVLVPQPRPERRAPAPDDDGGPLACLFVRDHGRIVPVLVEGVVRFEARGDYVAVHTRERRHLARLRLRDLERRLPPTFRRIHRSHIVNLACVESMAPHRSGRLEVRLHDGTRIQASRAHSRALRDAAV